VKKTEEIVELGSGEDENFKYINFFINYKIFNIFSSLVMGVLVSLTFIEIY